MESRIIAFLIVVAIVASFVISIAAYPWLPAVMATHWGMHDVANGFMSKGIGVFLLPMLMLFLGVLFYWLPKTDPLRRNYALFQREYLWVVVAIMAFFLALQVAIIAWNLGIPFSMRTVILPSVALLFFVMGMVMPRLKRNWYMGIRTPWTLSSDTVWTKTHSVGGVVFQVLAVIILASMLFPSGVSFFVLIGGVGSAVVGLVVYSYVLYTQKK